MGQSYGIPGRTRDSKDDLIELFVIYTTNDCPLCEGDIGIICTHEVPVFRRHLDEHGYQVDKQVDMLHAATSLLKVGDDNKRTRAEVLDYCRLHNEPIPFPTNETRPMDGNPPDAA